MSEETATLAPMPDAIGVERSGDRIWITSALRHKELIKQIPGHRYSQEHSMWWLPLSWAACVQARGVVGENLVIGPELEKWAWEEVTTRVQPCLELRDQPDAELPEGFKLPPGLELSPRQRAGVKFLATARRTALTDGMGSGKTVMMIVALELLAFLREKPFPALVICPNSMKYTWEREYSIWAPHRRVVVIAGDAQKRRKQIAEEADVHIINWEGLKGHSRLSGYGNIRLKDSEKEPKELNGRGTRTVVADEAHRGKNPKAQQTRAYWYIARECEFRFGLTGTPVANTPEDAWALMHAIEPAEWPAKGTFIDRYALQSWNQFGGMSVTGVRGEMREELFKILDPRFIRRPTEIVVEGIPQKLPPQIRDVELAGKQKKAYDQMRKELLAELDSGVLMATNPLTRMMRLMQLASAYGEVDADGNMTLTEPSSKLDTFEEVLEELDDEPAAVFAASKQLINLAAARMTKAKIPYALITGDVRPLDRQRAVDAFQAGDIRLVLCTLGAGAEGITLTAARYPIFLQRSFSLVQNKQAEDRTWRHGQTREVQPIDLVTRGTLEPGVLEIMREKGERLEEIARDRESIARWLSK